MTEQLGENLAGGADMIWEQAFQLATLQQQTAFLKQQNPAVGAIDERVVASYFSGVIIRIQGSPNEAVSVATRVPLSHAGLNEGSYLYVIRRLSVKGGCCECERMGAVYGEEDGLAWWHFIIAPADDYRHKKDITSLIDAAIASGQNTVQWSDAYTEIDDGYKRPLGISPLYPFCAHVHGVHGHLDYVNGAGSGLSHLSGTQILNVWKNICATIGVSQTTVQDVAHHDGSTIAVLDIAAGKGAGFYARHLGCEMVEGYGNPHSLAHYKKACKVVANIRLKDIAAGLYRRTVLQAHWDDVHTLATDALDRLGPNATLREVLGPRLNLARLKPKTPTGPLDDRYGKNKGQTKRRTMVPFDGDGPEETWRAKHVTRPNTGKRQLVPAGVKAAANEVAWIENHVLSLPEFCLEASKSYDPEAKQALVKKVKGYWDARSPLGLKSAESMVTKREQLDVALMVLCENQTLVSACKDGRPFQLMSDIDQAGTPESCLSTQDRLTPHNSGHMTHPHMNEQLTGAAYSWVPSREQLNGPGSNGQDAAGPSAMAETTLEADTGDLDEPMPCFTPILPRATQRRPRADMGMVMQQLGLEASADEPAEPAAPAASAVARRQRPPARTTAARRRATAAQPVQPQHPAAGLAAAPAAPLAANTVPPAPNAAAAAIQALAQLVAGTQPVQPAVIQHVPAAAATAAAAAPVPATQATGAASIAPPAAAAAPAAAQPAQPVIYEQLRLAFELSQSPTVKSLAHEMEQVIKRATELDRQQADAAARRSQDKLTKHERAVDAAAQEVLQKARTIGPLNAKLVIQAAITKRAKEKLANQARIAALMGCLPQAPVGVVQDGGLLPLPQLPQRLHPTGQLPQLPQLLHPTGQLPQLPQLVHPTGQLPQLPQLVHPTSQLPQLPPQLASANQVLPQQPHTPIMRPAPPPTHSPVSAAQPIMTSALGSVNLQPASVMPTPFAAQGAHGAGNSRGSPGPSPPRADSPADTPHAANDSHTLQLSGSLGSVLHTPGINGVQSGMLPDGHGSATTHYQMPNLGVAALTAQGSVGQHAGMNQGMYSGLQGAHTMANGGNGWVPDSANRDSSSALGTQAQFNMGATPSSHTGKPRGSRLSRGSGSNSLSPSPGAGLGSQEPGAHADQGTHSRAASSPAGHMPMWHGQVPRQHGAYNTQAGAAANMGPNIWPGQMPQHQAGHMTMPAAHTQPIMGHGASQPVYGSCGMQAPLPAATVWTHTQGMGEARGHNTAMAAGDMDWQVPSSKRGREDDHHGDAPHTQGQEGEKDECNEQRAKKTKK